MKYVQVPISALQELHPYHVKSALRESLSVSTKAADAEITGLTEWSADWLQQSVSVRWSWGVMRDIVVVLDPTRIETNIVLMLDSDQPAPRALSTIYLFEWIETLPWREFGIPALLTARHAANDDGDVAHAPAPL